MKKATKIVLILLALVACTMSAICGTHVPNIEATTYAMAVVLPTQQIVFIRQLQADYYAIDSWLNEAQDLSSFVEEGQTLRFPEAGSKPTVYKNSTSDIDSVEPTETVFDVPLDYYDSQNYKMRNINMHALPFDKIAYYTKLSSDAIKLKEVSDAAYAFAPTSAGNKKIIMPTTGPALNGLKTLTLADVITLARACDNAGFPSNGRNLVLTSDMWWDLVNNNDILKAQLGFQQQNGIINPQIINYYGFKIHKMFAGNTGVAFDITAGAKAAQGAVITGSVVPCGFVFVSTEVFRANGNFDMYLKDKAINTGGRATEFGFSHRFKADFTKDAQKYSAMIYQNLAS